MPKIQLLDKQVAELIAAGEVVERPSAVIKELVENSIDSDASVITVEIRRGGITYMRVTDNGCGIPKDDVPVAFLRHATSKVVTQDDLNSIGTLGFRGEALASISAVAHIELFTRVSESGTGTHYTCGGEEEAVLEEAGCPKGTTIVVRDLFFNTPARMKFLKKDSTEGNSVAGVLDKLAMSHPEISFRFFRDGKEQLHTPGDNKLSSAIYAVYGREFSKSLLPVSYQLEHIKVDGFITAPAGSRPNRSMQNFFINGRFVRSRTAMAALEEAYKGSIMTGKFPACVLHMQVAWSAVDVNVHPAKLEVRFVNERPIFDTVYHGVYSALKAKDGPKIMQLKSPQAVHPYAPKPEKRQQLSFQTQRISAPVLRDSAAQARDVGETHSHVLQLFNTPPVPITEKAPITPAAFSGAEAGRIEHIKHTEHSSEPQREIIKEKSRAADIEEPDRLSMAETKERSCESLDFSSRIIGEAFGTYIVIEHGPQELMLIDKHAAHERLLYERLKECNDGGYAQTLLEPIPVNLDKDEYSAVMAHLEDLSRAGFEVSDFGAGMVLVRSAPLLLEGEDAASAVMEIAGHLSEQKNGVSTEHMDWIYHNVACRAAIKAGDYSNPQELVALARELERNPQVRYCPHGRPVYVIIKRREIEKQFGRV